VLITRTPLRISIGGGGTDMPGYYRRRPALVISAAINRYCYIAVNKTFVNDYFVKYSELERVTSVDDLRHPIIREALRLQKIEPGIEIASMADIPAGTGLGSSGTFTVGLLRALHALKRHHVSSRQLAEEACRVEIDILDRPVGKQDQYIAAFGGLTCFRFHPDETVEVSPLATPEHALHDLEEHLLLFFTGYSRSASSILGDQRQRSVGGEATMRDSLEFIAEVGQRIKAALEAGDCVGFGKLMNEHWEYKRQRSSGISNSSIDAWYRIALDNGAVGGKLVGAGAGGFLLFYTQDPAMLRPAMAAAGLAETRFQFDFDGSIVLARG
jgi:D-glycero-alpha-D-manno-heptose-7-phosphate kinase